MTLKKKDQREKEPEEQVIQRFSYRCPYCGQPVSYDQFDLKVGENEVECSSCKKVFIKVVAPSFTEGGL